MVRFTRAYYSLSQQTAAASRDGLEPCSHASPPCLCRSAAGQHLHNAKARLREALGGRRGSAGERRGRARRAAGGGHARHGPRLCLALGDDVLGLLELHGQRAGQRVPQRDCCAVNTPDAVGPCSKGVDTVTLCRVADMPEVSTLKPEVRTNVLTLHGIQSQQLQNIHGSR